MKQWLLIVSTWDTLFQLVCAQYNQLYFILLRYEMISFLILVIRNNIDNIDNIDI